MTTVTTVAIIVLIAAALILSTSIIPMPLVQAQKSDNFTGPHYGMTCKDSPSMMCYYPAPSTPQPQQQQLQRNGTTIFGFCFGLPSFARTHNNITQNQPALPGGCLDDPAVACGP